MKTRLYFIVFLCIALTACSQLESVLPRYSDNAIQSVHIMATADVNQSTAVAADIVFIFEEALVAQLSNYTARKWFDEKNQFQLQYPGKFVIFSYELVPVSQATLTLKHQKNKFPIPYQKAFKVMTFANYLKESPDFTLDISPFKRPIITLGNSRISISEGK